MTSTPTYLTLKYAAELYGKNTDQILMEAAKGVERIELLYWVQYKDIHKDYEYREFEGINAAGDYLVLPKERIVELRHQGLTATHCFLYPTRSPMQVATQQLRRERSQFSHNTPEQGSDFLRCRTALIITPENNNLVVTTDELDRIWPRNKKGTVNDKRASDEITIERHTGVEGNAYPTELQVALEAQETFATEDGVTKSLSVITKWVKERLCERGVEAVEHHTCKRIAQLVTCNEVPAVLEAWAAVYGQDKGASRNDMEKYLAKKCDLNPNSNYFKRVSAVTTPDRKKKYRSRRKEKV